MRVRYYEATAGARPVEKYVEDLPVQERATIAAVLADLVVNGVAGAGATMRHLDGKLRELKISRHRIFTW